MKNILLLSGLAMLLFTQCVDPANQVPTKLLVSGDYEGTNARLVWSSLTYGESQEGVVVKRKEKESGNWEELTGLIKPGRDHTETIFARFEGSKELSELKKAWDKKKGDKYWEEVTFSYFKDSIYSKEDKAKNFLLNILLAGGIHETVLSGLGHIDESGEKGKTYTYGVFEVHNGSTNSTPSATQDWTYGQSSEVKEEIAVIQKETGYDRERTQVGVELIMNFAKVDVKKHKIFLYRYVYKTEDGVFTPIEDRMWNVNTAYEPVQMRGSASEFKSPEDKTYFIELFDMNKSLLKRIPAAPFEQ